MSQPQSPPIRVLIVDDDPLVRSGLRTMLGGVADLEIVGEAADGGEVPTAVEKTAPHVVLMDIRMPGTNGLVATERLRKDDPGIEVIVLTTLDSDDHVLRALRAGAGGFLLKRTPPAEIVDAIRRVAAGDPILSPSVIRQLINHVTDDTESAESARQRAAATALAGLSHRERQVANAIGEGKTNAEIAKELYMSLPTVKAHVTRLLGKLGLNNRVQIALLAHDAGQHRPKS
ncbi:response regulator transcription factor [Amycolatopsis plumensis]|uniref:Response regulator n=1 Tax=Amycolatopsis plumensis TaxID=236508 RepID=A0ABV5TUM4_9PSEU